MRVISICVALVVFTFGAFADTFYTDAPSTNVDGSILLDLATIEFAVSYTSTNATTVVDTTAAVVAGGEATGVVALASSNYCIRARAKNAWGGYSAWSDPYVVTSTVPVKPKKPHK